MVILKKEQLNENFATRLKSIGNINAKKIRANTTINYNSVLYFIRCLGYSFDDYQIYEKDSCMTSYIIQNTQKKDILLFNHLSLETLPKFSKEELYEFLLLDTRNARFRIITNGITYRFYDINTMNALETLPFFQFNIMNINKFDINILKEFHKIRFYHNDSNIDKIIAHENKQSHKKMKQIYDSITVLFS